MSTVYQYTPLSGLPDDTIRLLELCSGHGDEKIRGVLSTAQLTLRPTFAALSYVWGTEPASQQIELNGRQLRIRKNLWQCLWRLREPTRSLIIWIDAVCVNQGDIPERNQQVKFMKHIFGTAKPVLAWLGDDLGEMCATLQQDLSRFDLSLFWSDIVQPSTPRTPAQTTLRICRAIPKLCECQYWKRIWIVQEVLVAQDLILCFEGQRIAWEDFESFCKIVRDAELPDEVMKNGSELRWRILDCQHRVDFHGGRVGKFIKYKHEFRIDGIAVPTNLSLNRLMYAYGNSQCSDPRDKVYALLGLREHHEVRRLRDRPQLQADYSKSTADLFFDVLMFEGSLNCEFALRLYNTLDLNMQDLQQVSLVRARDTFSLKMKLQAKVRGVVFDKLETLAQYRLSYHLQVILITLKREDDESSTEGSLLEEEDEGCEEVLLAYATGHQAVKTGDYVFRIQSTSLLLVFRYERNYFRAIARLQKFMPDPTWYVRHEWAQDHFVARPLRLTATYAPGIDFEIWNGVQKLAWGPDVVLEVMRLHVPAMNVNFDGWLTNQDSPRVGTW